MPETRFKSADEEIIECAPVVCTCAKTTCRGGDGSHALKRSGYDTISKRCVSSKRSTSANTQLQHSHCCCCAPKCACRSNSSRRRHQSRESTRRVDACQGEEYSSQHARRCLYCLPEQQQLNQAEYQTRRDLCTTVREGRLTTACWDASPESRRKTVTHLLRCCSAADARHQLDDELRERRVELQSVVAERQRARDAQIRAAHRVSTTHPFQHVCCCSRKDGISTAGMSKDSQKDSHCVVRKVTVRAAGESSHRAASRNARVAHEDAAVQAIYRSSCNATARSRSKCGLTHSSSSSQSAKSRLVSRKKSHVCTGCACCGGDDVSTAASNPCNVATQTSVSRERCETQRKERRGGSARKDEAARVRTTSTLKRHASLDEDSIAGQHHFSRGHPGKCPCSCASRRCHRHGAIAHSSHDESKRKVHVETVSSSQPPTAAGAPEPEPSQTPSPAREVRSADGIPSSGAPQRSASAPAETNDRERGASVFHRSHTARVAHGRKVFITDDAYVNRRVQTFHRLESAGSLKGIAPLSRCPTASLAEQAARWMSTAGTQQRCRGAKHTRKVAVKQDVPDSNTAAPVETSSQRHGRGRRCRKSSAERGHPCCGQWSSMTEVVARWGHTHRKGAREHCHTTSECSSRRHEKGEKQKPKIYISPSTRTYDSSQTAACLKWGS